MRLFLFLFFFLSSLALGAEPQIKGEFFTIQVASFKDVSKAQELLKELSDLPYARISYRGGRYRVRVGFFKSFMSAKRFAEEKLRGRFRDFFITKTKFSKKNVIFAKDLVVSDSTSSQESSPSEQQSFSNKLVVSTDKKKDKVGVTDRRSTVVHCEDKEEVQPKVQSETELVSTGAGQNSLKVQEKLNESPSVSEKNLQIEKIKIEYSKSSVQKEKASSPNTFIGTIKYVFGVLILLATVSLLFLKLKTKRRESSDYLDKLIARLVKEGNCSELLDTVLPLLSSQPENTFLRKAVADCYLSLGKFLEAAVFYEEIAEILERKGLKVLSEEFKKRAEELYGREFKGRG